jgi:hypothetical protein
VNETLYTISAEEWAASDYATAQKCKKPSVGALGRLKGVMPYRTTVVET